MKLSTLVFALVALNGCVGGENSLQQRLSSLSLVGTSEHKDDGNLRVGNDGLSVGPFEICAFQGYPPGINGIDPSVTTVVAGPPLLRGQIGIEGGLQSGQISDWLKVPGGPSTGIFLVNPTTQDCATSVPLVVSDDGGTGYLSMGGPSGSIPMYAPGEAVKPTLVLFSTQGFFATTEDVNRGGIGQFPYR